MKVTFSSSCNERHIHVGEKFVETKSCSHCIFDLNARCSSVSNRLVLTVVVRLVRADIYIVDLPPYVKDLVIAWIYRNGVSKMKRSIAFWSYEDVTGIKWNSFHTWKELRKFFRQSSNFNVLLIAKSMHESLAADWFQILRNGSPTK